MSDVEQIERGATASLNSLYRHYSSWLQRRLRIRVGADEADDVVQETYLRIIPYALEDIRHPKAFLLRIALNLVQDERRRLGRRRDLMDATAITASNSAEPGLDALELKQILQTMAPAQRDVFVLSRFDGMSYAEIAAAHGISLATVERRMAKAIEHCMKHLDL